MTSNEREKTDMGAAIRDSFIDYGGAPNVVDGLMAIAKAIDKLADAITPAPAQEGCDGFNSPR